MFVCVHVSMKIYTKSYSKISFKYNSFKKYIQNVLLQFLEHNQKQEKCTKTKQFLTENVSQCKLVFLTTIHV